MKRVEPELIGKILEKAFQECDNSDNFLRQRASFYWIEVVGPGVNRYTLKRYVHHVYLTSASLKNELSFQRSAIIKRLNELVGKDVIKDIILH